MTSLLYVELRPSEWYYLREQEGGGNDWDWREDALAFGPFQTLDEAQDHHYYHHQNVSGSEIMYNHEIKPGWLSERVMFAFLEAGQNMADAVRCRY